ncbi:MAG: hypothetical protein AAF892_11625 [Cyanobacteria bacterium P01_D01_bin.71]
MGVGAYLHKVLKSSANASDRSYSLRLSDWQVLLWGAVSSLLLGPAAQAVPTPVDNTLADATVSTVTAADPIKDGVYFYGAAAEPDTLGAAYMVFEAQDTNLVGALFMPQSSFDCFRGQLNDQELALQITNSYTQEVYDYAIALITDGAPVASIGDSALNLRLDGFYNLGTPRDSEMAILSSCQADFSGAEVEL